MIDFSLTEEEKEQFKNLDKLSTSKRIELVYGMANKLNDYIDDNLLEILTYTPEVNATSTEEIRKAMEKVENEGT